MLTRHYVRDPWVRRLEGPLSMEVEVVVDVEI